MPPFAKLLGFLRRPAPEPTVDVRAAGFGATLAAKDGILLPAQQGDARYYEVALASTGDNPEYPADPEPRIARFTIGATDGMCLVGNVCCLPAGCRYVGFEVVEDYDDGVAHPGFMGRQMPPHHFVVVRAHFLGDGKKPRHVDVGFGAVRKSECETDAWRMAARSPVFCF
jgi:hypothetical protein